MNSELATKFAPNVGREQEVQTDLRELVQAVSKLRSAPGWESVVLSDPWVVMGSRAEELIRMEPAATFVSAP